MTDVSLQVSLILKMCDQSPALKPALLRALGVSKTGYSHNKYPAGAREMRQAILAGGGSVADAVKAVSDLCKEAGLKIDKQKLERTIRAELSRFTNTGSFAVNGAKAAP